MKRVKIIVGERTREFNAAKDVEFGDYSDSDADSDDDNDGKPTEVAVISDNEQERVAAAIPAPLLKQN